MRPNWRLLAMTSLNIVFSVYYCVFNVKYQIFKNILKDQAGSSVLGIGEQRKRVVRG